eukprot:6192278-Pleurochrysis_carterae.AAC.1
MATDAGKHNHRTLFLSFTSESNTIWADLLTEERSGHSHAASTSRDALHYRNPRTAFRADEGSSAMHHNTTLRAAARPGPQSSVPPRCVSRFLPPDARKRYVHSLDALSMP